MVQVRACGYTPQSTPVSYTHLDKATGKEQSIRIEASSGLSEDEINRMKAEAEQNAAADKAEREKKMCIRDRMYPI